MKKLFTIALFGLLALSFNEAKAQRSVGVEFGAIKLTGDAGEFFDKPMLGLSVNGKYDITEQLKFSVLTGFHFASYEIDYGFGTVDFFLMLTQGSIGVEYLFSENDFTPYGGLNLGLYSLSFDGESNGSRFGVAPVAGINYNITESIFLDANLKYHHIFESDFSVGAIGINAGLGFRF